MSSFTLQAFGPTKSCRHHKSLFFPVTLFGFGAFVDFRTVARLRWAMLMRDGVVLTTSLILVLRCTFLHSGIFTLRVIVLHGARSSVTWADNPRPEPTNQM